jgi:hypothetical protein
MSMCAFVSCPVLVLQKSADDLRRGIILGIGGFPHELEVRVVFVYAVSTCSSVAVAGALYVVSTCSSVAVAGAYVFSDVSIQVFFCLSLRTVGLQ